MLALPITSECLADRTNAGIYVALHHDIRTNTSFIEYQDDQGVEIFPVPNISAMDAFNHPNAYMNVKVHA